MNIIKLQNKYYIYIMAVLDNGKLSTVAFLPAKFSEDESLLNELIMRYKSFCNESSVSINREGFQVPHGKRNYHTACSARSVFVSEERVAIDGGTDTVITLKDPESGLLQHLHYEVYDESPALRRYVELENAGDKEITVEHLSSFAMANLPYFNDNDSSIFIHRFRSTWCKEGNHYINSLPELELYSSASQSAFVVQSNGTWVCQDYIPFFVLEQRNANLFTAVQIEHSAAWRFEMGLCECAAPNRFYMCGGMGNDIGCGWNTVLKSGEKLSSPKVSLAVNGDSLEGVLNDMHCHRSMVLIDRKQGDINLPVIYNDWMYIVGKNNEKTILEQLGILKETGVEVLVTDAGWFCDPDVSAKKGEVWHMTGHYDYNTERFPNGIKYVADKIKEQGIKPGIWCEIECLGEGSEFYNDKEMLLMYNDKFVTDGGHRFLNFTSPKVIKYADELFERFVEWGFEYIKIDYNSDSAPGATNCGSNNPAQGLYNNRKAYDHWLKAFRERHPQIIVESCSSGGMRLEYNSLSNADLGSVTDQNDFKVLGGMMYNITKVIHPSQCGMWAYTTLAKKENEFIFALANTMLGRMHLSDDFENLDNGLKKHLDDAVELYKSYRHIMSDCAVKHHSGLYYLYKNNEKVISYELRSKDNTESVILVERTESPDSNFTVKVEGLQDGIYSLDYFPYKSSVTMTAEELANGLSFELPQEYTAWVVYIHKS